MYYSIYISVDVVSEAQSITITTLPFLPDNIIATNYANLQLITLISASPITCSFVQDGGNEVLFYATDGCLPDVSNNQFNTVCQKNGNMITFTYTIKSPLHENMNYLVACFLPSIEQKVITLQVQGKTK